MTYTQPLMLFFLVVTLAGLVRLRHGKGAGLPIAGVAGLLVLSCPAMDWLLSRPLEARYRIQPFPESAQAPAQAIVVLSSAVSPPTYERPYAVPNRETFRRCAFAAWLHTHWRHLPVLACGGPDAKGKAPVSSAMRQLLRQAGVPDAMIWTEDRSRSPHQNAVFGAEILRQHGIASIALVVEARFMLRAAACFRKEGIAVSPAPCGFREFASPAEEFMPSWKAMRRDKDTLEEAAGLAWYWYRGWI